MKHALQFFTAILLSLIASFAIAQETITATLMGTGAPNLWRVHLVWVTENSGTLVMDTFTNSQCNTSCYGTACNYLQWKADNDIDEPAFHTFWYGEIFNCDPLHNQLVRWKIYNDTYLSDGKKQFNF